MLRSHHKAEVQVQYYQFLALYQPETLLDLYNQLNPGFSIQEDDLFPVQGMYNPENKWNNATDTGTIMHLCVLLRYPNDYLDIKPGFLQHPAS